jgi:glutaminyl-peptide cyclotransferase
VQRLLVLLTVCLLALPVNRARAGEAQHPYRIVNIFPHDPQAFTQGLLFDRGFLYESTGLNGRSTLRKVEIETGKVLQSISLPSRFFGEGLTLFGGRLIQLTWRSGTAFVYDLEDFGKIREFAYEGEGWGLTSDGSALVMSDGSARLRFLDPETFSEIRQIEVRDQGNPVPFLNELEMIQGEIFANIWQKDVVARIAPATGQVLGWIDLSDLRNALGPVRGVDVLNGIAYDREHNRIFVTGKLWPKLFELELAP